MRTGHGTRSEVIPAIYERGVLKLLRPVALRDRQRVEIAILPKDGWAKTLRRLLRMIHARPSSLRPREIEEEITRAREEARSSKSL